MKKLICGISALLLITTLTACGANKEYPSSNTSSQTAVSSVQSSSMEASPSSDYINISSVDEIVSSKADEIITKNNENSYKKNSSSEKSSSSSNISTNSASSTHSHTHSYKSTTVAATCTSGGYILKTCNCGESKKINKTNALGHKFSSWETVKAPTDTQNGTAKRSCSRCNETQAKTLNKLQNSNTSFNQEVLRLVNNERAKENLPALTYCYEAQSAADTRAEEIGTKFSHTRPDGSSCFTALDEINISYSAAGENIAIGYTTPEAVVNAWMNSSGHRANILNSNFNCLVVGVKNNQWVQLFMRR